MLVLEDKSYLDYLTKDELYGILTTYEMIIEPENVSKKEDAFKAIRKSKFRKNDCKNTTNISDEEEANFVRRLKRG